MPGHSHTSRWGRSHTRPLASCMQYNFKFLFHFTSLCNRWVGGLHSNGGSPVVALGHPSNDKQLTYYCPALIRQGLTQVKHMFVEGLP